MKEDIVKHVRGKAEFARDMARKEPNDATWWDYVAELFDTTAKEIDSGLLTTGDKS